jgi:endonuclease YncB( thermonuclease family)
MKKIILFSAILLFVSFGVCVLYSNNVMANEKLENGDKDEKKRLVVIRVNDGDTLKGVVDYKYQTIRIAGIDCPENKVNAKVFNQLKEFEAESQEELTKKGKEASHKLKKLLKFYEDEIYFVERPEMVCKYGNGNRLVGDLYAGGIKVSDYMIKEGGCVKMGCRK